MEFSIVITTYNRLSLLRRAVESALGQTLPCEVIIADDGSSDGTEEYIRSLNGRVKYHRNEVNLGHSKTVNAGVEIAQGDWIKLLDDDDYLTPECLQVIAETITSFPQAVLCSAQALQVDVQGQLISKKRNLSGQVRHVPQEDVHYLMLFENLPLGTPVQITFQKIAFLKSGGWDSYFDGNCDDIYSWLNIAKYGDVVLIDKYLSYRMVWPGSIHKKLLLSQRWEMNVKIKQYIYFLVSAKHRSKLPSFKDIANYLRIHWFFVGLKNQQFGQSFLLLQEAIFSYHSWLLWFQINMRKQRLLEKELSFYFTKLSSKARKN